jgi:type I restriction enzyme S subunit
MAGEWQVATFEKAPLEIIDGDRGTNYPTQTEFFATGHCLFLNAGNVTATGFKFSDCAFITAEKDASLRKGKLIRNDVVLTTRGTVGNAAYFDDSVPFDHIRINSGMVILRSQSAVLLPRYVYLFVRSALFHKQVSALRTGSAQPQLPIMDINRIEIPIPPLREQRAIAHILGTLDDKIELNRRMNATLEAMARALFKSWFVDFDPVRAKAEGRDTGLPPDLAALFPDGLVESKVGEIPTGWEVGTVGEHMVNFDSRRVPVSGAERAKRKGEYPYHGAAGVMDHVDDYLFDGVYLLVGEDGSVVQGDGMAVTQYVWGKLWVNNHAHVLQGKGPVSTEHLYLYFHFEPVAPYVTGAVQPKLSQGRMNMMPFVFAGADVCLAFAQMAQPWFAKLRANADENKILAALRDTLLPKLLSGEVRAADMNG